MIEADDDNNTTFISFVKDVIIISALSPAFVMSQLGLAFFKATISAIGIVLVDIFHFFFTS